MVGADGQYVCLEGDEIVAAFGLNDRPQGAFSKGEWERKLDEGEYLVIHALAIKPDVQKKGMVRQLCSFVLSMQKKMGLRLLGWMLCQVTILQRHCSRKIGLGMWVNNFWTLIFLIANHSI